MDLIYDNREVKRTCETSQIPVTGPGMCLVLVSIRPAQGTRPDEFEAFDSHARSSQIWYENTLTTDTSLGGRVDFRGVYLLTSFLSHISLSFFL